MAAMPLPLFCAVTLTAFCGFLALWGWWDGKFAHGSRDTSYHAGEEYRCHWCDQIYDGTGMFCDACLPAVARFNQYMRETHSPEVER
jgi:hypothetical protein